MMEVNAQIKTIRIPARKMRLVVSLIRRKPVNEAKIILDNTFKKAAAPLTKLLNAAIANAVNNNGLNADELFVKTVYVNEGPTLKRFRPRAHGRAFQILKRTSHVFLTLSDTKEVKHGTKS